MYTVSQACKRCGRTSKFPSTDKVRACPLCDDPTRSVANTLPRREVERLLPEQFKRKATR